MLLFDWGNRSPEQREAQRRLEMEAVYEQAARMARLKAAQTAAGAVGGGNSTNIYGVSAGNGKIYKVSGLSNETNYLIEDAEFGFPAPVAMDLNPEDGFLYGMVADTFFKVNRTTREIIGIGSNVNELHTKGVSSIYYEGDGNFIYVDNLFKNTITSIIRINSDGTATELFEQDVNEDGYFIRSLFKYKDEVWAIAITTGLIPNQVLAFKINVNTGEVLTEPMSIQLSQPGIESAEAGLIFNAISIGNSVYASIAWTGDEIGRTSLFRVDLETGVAKFVSELINEEDSLYIWNLSAF